MTTAAEWESANLTLQSWSNEHGMRAHAPAGGWGALAYLPENYGEMRRRVALVLDVQGHGETGQGRALASFAAGLPAAPQVADHFHADESGPVLAQVDPPLPPEELAKIPVADFERFEEAALDEDDQN
jgi:hypothetical protein